MENGRPTTGGRFSRCQAQPMSYHFTAAAKLTLYRRIAQDDHMKIDSGGAGGWPRPYGARDLLVGAIPGFRCASPWAIFDSSLRDEDSQPAMTLKTRTCPVLVGAIPGFRCASPWAIFGSSLRDEDSQPAMTLKTRTCPVNENVHAIAVTGRPPSPLHKPRSDKLIRFEWRHSYLIRPARKTINEG